MKKIIISAIMGLMAVCGMAQEKVYVHKTDGTAVAFDISEVAEINFVAPEEPESTAPEGVEFVQLYENGPKWANMNIGATSVTDAGLYFWWGDVQGHAKDESPKFKFSYDNAAITSYRNNEGYVADGKLVAEKDAATQLWGAGYRMPTQAELQDLCNKCTWTWKTNYNGVDKAKGYLVQGKGEYADNSIFLPAAGLRDGENLGNEGSRGYYWSSTPNPDDARKAAYNLNFRSDLVNPDSGPVRYYGFPVRPVSDLTINDIADAFKTKYATVLALEEETLTADDRESVKKALSEYSELSSEVKALLVEEKAKLEALMAAMPSEALSFVQLYENGPKWANMNIGATSVTDAGLYFWWGDVQGHAEGDGFKFSSSNTAITSYGNNEGYVADGKLVAEKDAATQQLGAAYRMPTQAEFVDLCNKCTWTWQTNYNGVEDANGYLITGKGDYSGNSIFLPAAGFRDGEDLGDEGSRGFYWSSIPDPDFASLAYDLVFDSDGVYPNSGDGRYDGFPVRPVSEL